MNNDATSLNQDSSNSLFALLFSTRIGQGVLIFLCLTIFYVLWAGKRVEVGPVSLNKGNNEVYNTDTSNPLFAFQQDVENKIEQVYTLHNHELEQNGHRTGYSDTLNFILLELIDIRYKKIKLIKSDCGNKDNMQCLLNKIAEKNAYVNDLIQQNRVPLTK
jgi:hypothetical protein